MRRIHAPKRTHNIRPIPTLHKQRRYMDLRHHPRLLPSSAAFGLRQTSYSSAAGYAAVGVEEDNYITLFMVEDGEEHLVADVLRVVFDCNFGCGANGGQECREREVAGELEVCAKRA